MGSRRQFGSVRKLPSGRWQARYEHNGQRYPAPGTFARKGDASAWLAEVETAIRRGTWADPEAGKVTVGEWLEHWLSTVVHGRVGSDNTVALYSMIVRRHLAPALGRVSLADLTPGDVDELLADKANAGFSRSYVRRMRMILADALRHAERRGFISRNAAVLSVMPRTPSPTPRRSLTVTEAWALLEAAKGERLEALIVLGLMVGMRPGELTGLLWDDLDLGSMPPTAKVSGSMKRRPDGSLYRDTVKRSKAGLRTVALPPIAVEALRAHHDRQAGERSAVGFRWQDNGLVFASETGRPVHPSHLRRTFKRIAAKAGIEGANMPYLLRHSAVSLLIDAGAGIEQVADLLGDDPTTLHRHYRHRVRPVADASLLMQDVFGP